MTIRHLKIFLTVAKRKKMSLAAEELYISQPTVSQAIRELEEHYGVRLFERLSKQLYITEAGEELVTGAADVVRRYEEVEAQMQEKRRGHRLRIGATLTVGSCVIPEILRRLKEIYPEADLFTCIHNTEMIERKLLDAELDIALVEGEIKSRDLVCSPVMEDELVMVCGGNHPFAGKEQVTYREVEKQRFVVREKGSGTRELVEHDFQNRNMHIKIAWEISGIESLKQAVMEDGCLSVISKRLVEKELHRQEMYAFQNAAGVWKRDFHLVQHKDKYQSPVLEAFIRSVREEKRSYSFSEEHLGQLCENNEK